MSFTEDTKRVDRVIAELKWFGYDVPPRDTIQHILAIADMTHDDLALCDGCDQVRLGVKATDDGRAQMCMVCLPEANKTANEGTT